MADEKKFVKFNVNEIELNKLPHPITKILDNLTDEEVIEEDGHDHYRDNTSHDHYRDNGHEYERGR